MTGPVTIWTYDWVPEGPRGYVRDLRLRWACREAGISYHIATVPFDCRETNHLDRQPFGQVPMLEDGDIRMFESGAGLIHLARRSERLMPRDPVLEAEVVQWIVAALNSIEMVTMPWVVLSWN
ncbi:glutathione S-transferase N-terminal domain-containing protein [Qipengyuania sp. MTN3-11]|uniref:glutathione S-transferase N-terminal domain-containing protein n=1 Tax=Qipengyuania sp. MTN3-11 TaxID=3056557 RepID=UPI0036F2A58D